MEERDLGTRPLHLRSAGRTGRIDLSMLLEESREATPPREMERRELDGGTVDRLQDAELVEIGRDRAPGTALGGREASWRLVEPEGSVRLGLDRPLARIAVEEFQGARFRRARHGQSPFGSAAMRARPARRYSDGTLN